MYDAARLPRRHSNIMAFVLNSQGEVVHVFDALSSFGAGAPKLNQAGMTSDLKHHLERAKEKLSLPKLTAKKTTLTLPDVDGSDPLSGVRVYLWFGENHLDHFRVPTVEAVAARAEERAALKWSDAAHPISARALERWLAQVYPPAVMDGMGGFASIGGELSWKPAGEAGEFRFATLMGTVTFEMDNRNRSRYEGPLELVLKYRTDRAEPVALRGVLDTSIPRQGPDGRVNERVRMLTTLESLPAEKW